MNRPEEEFGLRNDPCQLWEKEEAKLPVVDSMGTGTGKLTRSGGGCC